MTTHGRYYVVADGKPLLIVGRCYGLGADGIATFWEDLFQFEFWDVKQNLIPYVRQMVFAYVFIEGWIIYPYVYCFFHSCDQVLVLPPHSAEVVNCGTMTSDGRMVIYWGGGLQMFPEPFSKSSWWLPCIFIITVHPVALISVDDATLLCDGIFIFRSHQEDFDGITSFAIYPYPMFSAYILYVFTQPLYIWHHHIGPWIAICNIGADVSPLLVLFLSWGCFGLYFHHVQSSHGVLIFL